MAANVPSRLAKEFDHLVEAGKTFVAKALHLLAHTLHGFRRVAQMGLAKELVGVAYQFFLYAQREHVAMRQRQLLRHNVVQRQPCARVPLAHHGMAEKPQAVEHFATHDSVTDVGLSALTMNAWRIHLDDAYVVEHSGLVHKFGIDGSASLNESVA